MQFLILGILLDGPLSLYDVRKRFTAGISLFYASSFGGIQRALRQLESNAWVSVTESDDTRRRKKLYAINAVGQAAWHEWMHAPITASDAEPTMLAKVFLLGQLEREERPACIALLRERIASDAERLTSLATDLDTVAVHPDAPDPFTYQRMTLDYGIRAHDLALRWLDEVEHA